MYIVRGVELFETELSLYFVNGSAQKHRVSHSVHLVWFQQCRETTEDRRFYWQVPLLHRNV